MKGFLGFTAEDTAHDGREDAALRVDVACGSRDVRQLLTLSTSQEAERDQDSRP